MKKLLLPFILLAQCAIVLMASAQPSPSGTVTGRIFNPATGEYVRNAVIQVKGSGASAISTSGGEYRLFPVSPGKVTLTVSYTGYQTVTATANVPPGATITRDFELVSSLAPESTTKGEAVKLDAFVVASQREGAAKAIMDQRNSMNITNTVASDSFGDNAEGNVGEFLKHLPGVELETFFGEVRTVRLGGMPSDYTAVTMDGMPLASVDAGTTTRAFTMEMASLNSVESIEIAKTISADVDANAPAGTINLRTKRAFDRAGRRVSWQSNITAHSEAFNFRRTLGPDEDRRTMKLRPGGIFEYSDIFLDKRLGVVLNVSESNVYQDAITANMAYSTTTSATDLRPLVPTSVTYQWAPRFNKRFAITLAADYKINANLNVGLGLVYNYVDLWTPQRNIVFNVGARANVVGNDPVLSFTSAPNGSVQTNPVAVAKLGETTTLLPRFSYRRGNFELEGRASYSDSISWYDPLGHRGSIRDFNGPTAPNITFRAQRSGPLTADWKITQIAGPDINSGASFSSPVLSTNDGRFARTQLITGDLIATLKTEAVQPVIWKTGLKRRHQSQKFEDDTLARRYDLIGNPTTGGWANYPTPWPFNIGMSGGSITSLSNGGLFMPNVRALGKMFTDNPGQFRQNWGSNATNFYESYVARRRRLYEQVDAGFLMGTTTWQRLTARAGLRWEGTTTEASEPDTRTPSEVRAAGFPVNASGVATTAEGVAYQFLSQPRLKRIGTSDNFFPSASLKYQLAQNVDAQLGFSSTIRRPPYANLAGVWIVNETLRTVTAPNAALKPETSKNFTGRIAYYSEPVGLFAVTATQRNVKNIFITDTLTAQEFGYTGDDDLKTYEFITTQNGPDTTRVRSFEIEYNQSLAFLGSLFKRLTVRGSYTRAYAAIRTPGITPRLASGGVYYTLNRLQVYANYNWADDWLRNVQTNVFRRHRSNLDLGGSWRLNQTYQLSAGVRNVLNQPWIDLQPFPNGATAMTLHQTVGLSWTFAIKGTY